MSRRSFSPRNPTRFRGKKEKSAQKLFYATESQEALTNHNLLTNWWFKEICAVKSYM